MSVIAPAVACSFRARASGPKALDSWVVDHGLDHNHVRRCLLMQGRVYQPNGGDILDILGFVATWRGRPLHCDPRAGLGDGAIPTPPPIMAQVSDRRRTAEFICAADAYHIAIGKKRDRKTE